jgi:hypothetical protein
MKTEIKIIILNKENNYCIYWDNPDYELSQVFTLPNDLSNENKLNRIEHYSRGIVGQAIKAINGVENKSNISVLGWSIKIPDGEKYSLVEKFKQEHNME